MRNKKLELLKMFAHHDTGIIPINKSPHLPCGFKVVANLGRNFKVLKRTSLKTSK
jgi:hypothetical protein